MHDIHRAASETALAVHGIVRVDLDLAFSSAGRHDARLLGLLRHRNRLDAIANRNGQDGEHHMAVDARMLRSDDLECLH